MKQRAEIENTGRFSKALIKMEVACATGGEALDDFAMVCGLTADQFKVLFDADPAAAFQLFITRLAQVDEAGFSSIAVLNEIGISEVRLRDTLLRAVNATELFANTQYVANQAWQENTALSEEANKRYATTASRLTNLKNKALLFAQQLGDDLNPTIHDLIGSADELLDSFLEMDESQRTQIIQLAAYAAAAGPVVLALGKITTGVGKVATGIGKFTTSVGKAGGGLKGFMTVLAKSPAVWMAVAAAAITGTVAFIDYASGAKQVREALEGMNETAEKWKNNAADTFYSRSSGLAFFGMSAEDFTKEGSNLTEASQAWLSELLTVWSDGKKETNAIVKQYTDGYKESTAPLREALTNLQSTASAAGYTDLSTQMAEDLKTLDNLDAEIGKLLKRRQSKLFTDKDKVRLQELIDTRQAIAIKYNLVPDEASAEGFDTIRKKLEAEIARAQARGLDDAAVSVYENAVLASAEGLAAINRQLDEQYDKEYALIQMMTNEEEKQRALAALNAQYTADRKAAAAEYSDADLHHGLRSDRLPAVCSG